MTIFLLLLTTSLHALIEKIDDGHYRVSSEDLRVLATNAEMSAYWEAETKTARADRDRAETLHPWLFGAGFVVGFMVAK